MQSPIISEVKSGFDVLRRFASHRPRDRVRIRSKCRPDAFGLMRAGNIEVIEALEQNAEDKIHLPGLEDDPGKDLGMVSHPSRFFYGLNQIEPLKEVLR